MLQHSQQPTKCRFTIKADCWSFHNVAGDKSLMEHDTVSTGNHLPVRATLTVNHYFVRSRDSSVKGNLYRRGISLQQNVQTASGANPASCSMCTGVPSYTCSLIFKKSHMTVQRNGQCVLQVTGLIYRTTVVHLAPVGPIMSSAC
jgi:hypothetical protein